MDINDMIDPIVEDVNLIVNRYKEAEKTRKCPECRSKVVTYEVSSSFDPDDIEVTGLRAYCKNPECKWKIEEDF